MDVAGETTIFYAKILNHPIDSQPFIDGWPSGSYGKKQLGPSMFWRVNFRLFFRSPRPHQKLEIPADLATIHRRVGNSPKWWVLVGIVSPKMPGKYLNIQV